MATFGAKMLAKDVAKLLTLKFSHVFFLKALFVYLILPAEIRIFLKKKTNKKEAMI